MLSTPRLWWSHGCKGDSISPSLPFSPAFGVSERLFVVEVVLVFQRGGIDRTGDAVDPYDVTDDLIIKVPAIHDDAHGAPHRKAGLGVTE
jgi:hypothetical protein